MHLTRPLQFRAAQQDPEPAAFCVQVMASVREKWEKYPSILECAQLWQQAFQYWPTLRSNCAMLGIV
jgi:hypothetical protein